MGDTAMLDVSVMFDMPAILPGAEGSRSARAGAGTSSHAASKVQTLQSIFEGTLRRKLDVLESIRADLNEEKISVPGIIVAGNQSTGKSSVLESVSGIPLPRGETITTRVPLILRLERNESLAEGEVRMYIGSDPDVIGKGTKVGIEDVSAKIQEITECLVGKENPGGVSDAPIHLKVMRRDSPTLTLIDLPGLAYMSADEGQASTIYEQTAGLVRKYAQSEENIIFVVLPGADDFASHESIKIAKEFDPNGERTLGVVTKIDRVEQGTDIISKLKGEGKGHIKLKLGFVAVRNRTPQEVKDGLRLSDARQKEQDFFEASGKFVPGTYGIPELITRAVDIQTKRVDEFIPRIRKVLVTKINNIRQQLTELAPVHETDAERHAYFIDVVGKLIAKFQGLATGAHVPDEQFERFALASQAYSRFDEFKSTMQSSTTNFITKEYHEVLEKQVRLVRGASLSNFMSSAIFAKQVRIEYSTPLRDHALELVDHIEALVSEAFEELINNGMGDTEDVGIEAAPGSLKDAIRAEIAEFISVQKAECLKHITTLCDAESYIFTLDHSYTDFISKLAAQWKGFSNGPQGDSNSEGQTPLCQESPFLEMISTYCCSGGDARAICEMQASIDSYVKIRQRSMGDQVPLTIRLFLIRQMFQGNHGSITLSRHLHEKIGSAESLKNHLSEDHGIARLREELKASLVRCERARDQLRTL